MATTILRFRKIFPKRYSNYMKFIIYMVGKSIDDISPCQFDSRECFVSLAKCLKFNIQHTECEIEDINDQTLSDSHVCEFPLVIVLKVESLQCNHDYPLPFEPFLKDGEFYCRAIIRISHDESRFLHVNVIISTIVDCVI
jgi:hypothetical protein